MRRMRDGRKRRDAGVLRSRSLEVLDLTLNHIGERRATPTEAIDLVTLALKAFEEGTVERKLVGVLWKFVAQ